MIGEKKRARKSFIFEGKATFLIRDRVDLAGKRKRNNRNRINRKNGKKDGRNEEEGGE